MIGGIFEREIIRGFFKCQSQIEILPYYLKTEKDTENKEPAKPFVISTVVRVISFTKDTEIPQSRPLLYSCTCARELFGFGFHHRGFSL